MERREMKRDGGGMYRNPCLPMHQPWSPLLGPGTSASSADHDPLQSRGRLWIHVALEIPEPETIKAMEDFQKEICAVSGFNIIKFPHIIRCRDL